MITKIFFCLKLFQKTINLLKKKSFYAAGRRKKLFMQFFTLISFCHYRKKKQWKNNFPISHFPTFPQLHMWQYTFTERKRNERKKFIPLLWHVYLLQDNKKVIDLPSFRRTVVFMLHIFPLLSSLQSCLLYIFIWHSENNEVRIFSRKYFVCVYGMEWKAVGWICIVRVLIYAHKLTFFPSHSYELCLQTYEWIHAPQTTTIGKRGEM